MKKITQEDFILKAQKIHNNKYDYSKVVYKNIDSKVCIICPKHGEFWQSPYNHNKGQGCPLCGTLKQGQSKRKTLQEFIEDAKKIHGDKYDYSKVDYINNNTAVEIICKKHGIFNQTPGNHLRGEGCPYCSHELLSRQTSLGGDNFIQKARQIHNNKYDYSKVKYVNNRTKVCIICPEHGEFWQTPSNHLNGRGCPKCKNNKLSEMRMHTTEEFIRQSIIRHHNFYSYSDTIYEGNRIPLRIECPIHGEFWQTPHEHLIGHGCPLCGNNISHGEDEIYDFCCSIMGSDNVMKRNREVIAPYELDIYIPSLNIGIEYNGLRWHSELFNKDRNYHLHKLELCRNKNIRLIQVFEDEYRNHKEIVLHKIRHIMGQEEQSPKIMARKCNIRCIDYTVAKEFLSIYHIQGVAVSTVYLGAFYETQLIGVMSFVKEQKDSDKWELNRFATDYNYVCCGVGGKLFKYFLRVYNPTAVKSFADRRWTVEERDNIYTKLNFEYHGCTKPDYRYTNSKIKERIHKFNFRKQILHKKYNLPLTMTENEMTQKLGYYRIWDCGLIKYFWTKS